MSACWISTDHHLGHHKMCKEFKFPDGSPLRPYEDASEMYRDMLEKHNALVKPQDRVYFVGDVSILKNHIELVQHFNGRKVLIKGNHDVFRLRDYAPYFDDIRASVVKAGCIITHIPVHPASKGRFEGNLHGHVHANTLDDPWYLNLCPENIGYSPLRLEDAVERVKNQQFMQYFLKPVDETLLEKARVALATPITETEEEYINRLVRTFSINEQPERS